MVSESEDTRKFLNESDSNNSLSNRTIYSKENVSSAVGFKNPLGNKRVGTNNISEVARATKNKSENEIAVKNQFQNEIVSEVYVASNSSVPSQYSLGSESDNINIKNLSLEGENVGLDEVLSIPQAVLKKAESSEVSRPQLRSAIKLPVDEKLMTLNSTSGSTLDKKQSQVVGENGNARDYLNISNSNNPLSNRTVYSIENVSSPVGFNNPLKNKRPSSKTRSESAMAIKNQSQVESPAGKTLINQVASSSVLEPAINENVRSESEGIYVPMENIYANNDFSNKDNLILQNNNYNPLRTSTASPALPADSTTISRAVDSIEVELGGAVSNPIDTVEEKTNLADSILESIASLFNLSSEEVVAVQSTIENAAQQMGVNEKMASQKNDSGFTLVPISQPSRLDSVATKTTTNSLATKFRKFVENVVQQVVEGVNVLRTQMNSVQFMNNPLKKPNIQPGEKPQKEQREPTAAKLADEEELGFQGNKVVLSAKNTVVLSAKEEGL